MVPVLGATYNEEQGRPAGGRSALDVLKPLQEKGAIVNYHDELCPRIRDDGHAPIKRLPIPASRSPTRPSGRSTW
jgi:hypothetical protein